MSRALFNQTLSKHYTELFATEPETYAMAASRYTPDALADKITDGLANGSANKDGEGVKRTCKDLGVKHTYAAIRPFLLSE